MRTVIIIVLALAFSVWFIGVQSVEWIERQLVFFPARILENSPRDLGLPYEDAMIETSDGVKLHGWYVPAEGEKARMIFFHGNGGNISGRLYLLPEFNRMGISVLLPDYRGYGKSQGVPSELGIYADAKAALEWLKNHSKHQTPLIYFGESLGSAVAVDLAFEVEEPQKLIIQGGFTSARAMAKVMYSFLGTALPITYRFDSVTKIRKLRCPLLSIHGTEDDIVPYALGSELFDAHPGPKEFFPVRGAHHNDLVDAAGSAYYDRIGRFLFGVE